MLSLRKTTVAATVLLFGVAGCDLAVTNPNQPDTDRVLATPGDVESLIAGAYDTWWHSFSGSGAGIGLRPLLSVAAFQHSAWPANFGMVDRSTIPRTPVNNNPADAFAGNFERHWYENYAAISAAVDGLGAIARGVDVPNVQRAEAFARFNLGLAHAHLALLFDQAFIFDDTTPLDEAGVPDSDLVPYNEVMEAALGYFDQTIALSQGAAFTIPAGWMSVEVSADRLARLAHSYKARFRTQVARTPDERAAINWAAVIADVDAGITSDFEMDIDDSDWNDWNRIYTTWYLWSQTPYFIHGMADQSGKYQEWLAMPVGERHPDLASGPFLIQTPDQRFPQGATRTAQEDNPGLYYHIPANRPSPSAPGYSVGTVAGQWGQAGRGTWRWSYYRNHQWDFYQAAGFVAMMAEMTVREMQLIKAEGLYRTGNPGGAASIINESRVAVGGLNPTNADGLNTDCVPRLPNGSCGDLLEMLKWEKRMETYLLAFAGWYFDSRGWGDLAEGSFLSAPVVAKELQVLDLPVYTLGGVGQPGGAPVGNYGW